jgi:hypothetical protein
MTPNIVAFCQNNSKAQGTFIQNNDCPCGSEKE